MKVRITGNKIRFRLKEPEVKQLQQEGNISEILAFGCNENEQLIFIISTSENNYLSLDFSSNKTALLVPKPLLENWTLTDLVGFYAEVDTGRGKTVSILVEKDFMCLDKREEDDIGSYPNPIADTRTVKH